MAPGASFVNDGVREFYAPLITEPSTTKERQSIPRVEHPKSQRPIKAHTSQIIADRPKKSRLLREIEEYKAGDEFVLFWKWVDDFMDKWRAKKKSSKSHNVNKTTLRQPKPTISSSHEARRVPRPAFVSSVEAVRRQTTDIEDLCEYKAQRHAPRGKLLHLYQNWKDQQAKKQAGQTRQRQGQKIAGGQASEHRYEPTRGHSINQPKPPQTTVSPLNQGHAAGHQPGIAKKAVPVYNKKRGEVQKHAVQITQQSPIHSVHLEHTPSNNYRTKLSVGQKNKSARDTRFSDFLHEERNPSSRETRQTNGVPTEGDELVRNSRFSSKLDPAKAVKKAKEAEKVKGLKCYICSSTNCHGGYRDHISRLWLCAACQQKENRGPKQCSCCGTPNSPNTTYADNGLWLCTNVSPHSDFFLPFFTPNTKGSANVGILQCRSPTSTLKELPPVAKLAPKAPSKPNEYCECQTPCPPIEHFHGTNSLCPICSKRLTPFPVIESSERDPRAGYEVPLSEYDSDYLYLDDSYDTRATTPPAQKPLGQGMTFPDEEEEEEEEEEFRPTPPLKDSKYFQDSSTFAPMDYRQSYLRKPGAKHPYAPSTISRRPPSSTPRRSARPAAAPRR